MKALFEQGVSPSLVAEECVAVGLYTLEMKGNPWKKDNPEHSDPELQSVYKDTVVCNKVHGYNPSLFAVMNWALRVYRDPAEAMKQSDEDEACLKSTIQLFLPLLARVDVFLSRLPVKRQSLYRGMGVAIPPSKYSPGSIVPWSALSSTSTQFEEAVKFGTGTLFIALVHNAATIDFVTAYPEEAECLLPSYTWMRAVGVMSPTLLRMLNSTSTYITIQAVGDKP
eukprot:PhF_6_TR36074/c1_g1_i1/m.52397